MNARYLFYVTLIASIVVQIVTGIIEFGAFFVKIPDEFSIIRQLLAIELAVQVLEGSFYFWLAYNFNKVLNVTPKRYIDWVITTPSMLIMLMMYLIYLNDREEGKHSDLDIFTIFKDNLGIFIPVLLLNWLMLLFGYLGEMRIIPVSLGILLGFIPFLIYYYMIYSNYVTQNGNGHLLFWYFFVFWSLYGAVAVLPYYLKNAFYNILDLFSKNFFGVFLSYIILSGNY